MKYKPIKLTDKEIGYLAGIIDGEGSISAIVAKTPTGFRYKLSIDITNTDRKMLIYISKVLGNKPISKNGWVDPRGTRKPSWRITLWGNTLRWLLPQIVNSLVTKKDRANLALKCLKLLKPSANKYKSKSHLKRLDKIFFEIRKLNNSNSRNYT